MYSARTDIIARYSRFAKNLKFSPSDEIRLLFNIVSRDVRSTTGSNLKFIGDASALDHWSVGTGSFKRAVYNKELVEVPDLDSWRVRYLWSLLSQRQNADLYGQDTDRIRELINSLCIN